MPSKTGSRILEIFRWLPAVENVIKDCNSNGFGSSGVAQGEKVFAPGRMRKRGQIAKSCQRCLVSIWKADVDWLANWNSICIKEMR